MCSEAHTIKTSSKSTRSFVAAAMLLAMTLVSLSSPRADVTFLLEKEKGEDKSSHELELSGRLYTLFWYRDEIEKPKNEIQVEMARIQLKWKYKKRLQTEVSVDLDGIYDDSPHQLLRDAFVSYRFFRELRLRFGQFKRPFTWLETTSREALPVIRRGAGNEFMIRDLGYGSRDVGVELFGLVGHDFEVEYALGVFGGEGIRLDEQDLNGAKDVSGRIRVKPVDWLRVGGSFTVKMFDTGVRANVPDLAWAAAGELRLKFGDFRFQGEFIWGENWSLASRPDGFDVLGLARYTWDIPGTKEMKLQPMFRLGLLVPDQGRMGESKIWTYTPGVNWIVNKAFRLMVQGHIVRSGARTQFLFPDSTGVMVQGAVDL